MTGLWAEGFSAADLRHGPRAAALGLPALVLPRRRPARRPTSTGSSASSPPRARRSSRSAPGRALPAAAGLCEELAPIALIVPAQLVAERLAVLRGRDPDRPPGLTKVTRTH